MNLIDSFDELLLRRPRLMIGLTVAAALIGLLVLLAQPQGAVVLYQAF